MKKFILSLALGILVGTLQPATAFAGTIVITVTNEEIKAVEGQVISAQAWLQKAWDMKAELSMDKVIIRESNLNASKLDKTAKKNWIRDNSFNSRVERDAQ